MNINFSSGFHRITVVICVIWSSIMCYVLFFESRPASVVIEVPIGGPMKAIDADDCQHDVVYSEMKKSSSGTLFYAIYCVTNVLSFDGLPLNNTQKKNPFDQFDDIPPWKHYESLRLSNPKQFVINVSSSFKTTSDDEMVISKKVSGKKVENAVQFGIFGLGGSIAIYATYLVLAWIAKGFMSGRNETR